jgi:7,8-dihydropterin-6-yl-methyl-4-(beta-D-ribofuranosyl)aminobenzene 5'-phosphate synthase
VEFIAPVHCTGEAAFAILKQVFGDRYVYAGLGTRILLGPTVKTIAEGKQPRMQAMDEEDLRRYRTLLAQSDDDPKQALAQNDPQDPGDRAH